LIPDLQLHVYWQAQTGASMISPQRAHQGTHTMAWIIPWPPQGLRAGRVCYFQFIYGRFRIR
jgi:hypothetical protein